MKSNRKSKSHRAPRSLSTGSIALSAATSDSAGANTDQYHHEARRGSIPRMGPGSSSTNDGEGDWRRKRSDVISGKMAKRSSSADMSNRSNFPGIAQSTSTSYPGTMGGNDYQDHTEHPEATNFRRYREAMESDYEKKFDTVNVRGPSDETDAGCGPPSSRRPPRVRTKGCIDDGDMKPEVRMDQYWGVQQMVHQPGGTPISKGGLEEEADVAKHKKFAQTHDAVGTSSGAPHAGRGHDFVGYESGELPMDLALATSPAPLLHPQQTMPGAVAVPGLFGERINEYDDEERSFGQDDVGASEPNNQVSTGMLQAVAVTSVPAPEHVEAKVLPKQNLCKEALRNRKFRLVLVVVVLVLVAGFTVMGIMISKGKNSEPPTAPPRPTVAPTPQVLTEMPTLNPTDDPATVDVDTVALVMENTLNPDAFNNTLSPEYRALQWLRNNSKLATYSDRKKLQRYALVTLFFSTNGPNWRKNGGWLSDDDECTNWAWDDSKLDTFCSDGEHAHTFEMNIENVAGTLPPDLALMSDSLLNLGMHTNEISGAIPTSFGRFTNLVSLDLNRNKLSSSIPSEFGLLTSLKIIQLFSNNLGGPIPSTMGLLGSLEQLDLNDNELTGTIPTEIATMSSLSLFRVGRSQLTGTVPTEIKQMTNLDLLDLSGNNLTPPYSCPDFIATCCISCPFCDSSDISCRDLQE